MRERLNRIDELLLLDVFNSDDYAGELGQITGSRNIALDELEPCLPELSSYRDKPIVLVCTTDRRSQKAARILAKQGFADVRVVTGEMAQWNRDGLSVLSHTN